MEQTERLTLPRLVSEHVAHRSMPVNVMLVVAASVILAISAQIAVPLPFSPVPFTMQTLAVLLIGATLGSRRGAAAAALYLAEGATGLPVFAGAAAGPFILFGTTAGYLLAFPLAAWIAGFVSEKGWGQSIVRTVAGMALALAVIHLGGWSWLVAALGLSPAQAFAAGTAPFLVADALKLALAASMLPAVQRLVNRVR